MRRQLSYFSFIRISKGRQAHNAVYVNEAVVELRDLLHLKRKTADNNGASGVVSALGTQANPQKRKQSASDHLALAVSSGKLHASEANNEVSTKEYAHDPLDSDGSKSVSSSLTLSKSRADRVKSSKKVNRRELLAKYPRKTRRRVKKLLSLNGIVPFLNLAPPSTVCVQESISKDNCNQQTTHQHRSDKKISGSDSASVTTKARSNTASSDSSDGEKGSSSTTLPSSD